MTEPFQLMAPGAYRDLNSFNVQASIARIAFVIVWLRFGNRSTVGIELNVHDTHNN